MTAHGLCDSALLPYQDLSQLGGAEAAAGVIPVSIQVF